MTRPARAAAMLMLLGAAAAFADERLVSAPRAVTSLSRGRFEVLP